MRGGLLTLVLCCAVTIGSGAAQDKKAPAKLTGTIECKDATAVIPAGAVVHVKLEDTSLADAPARTIAQQKIDKPGKFPLDFAVEYDPADIKPGLRYTMRVRIEREGALLFINDTAIPVLTNGSPSKNVKVPVIVVRMK